jgi:hypothetical protein
LEVRKKMDNEWSKYEKLVLSELQRLNENIEEVSQKTHSLDKEISVVKVKASIFATVSATITSLAVIIIETIFRRYQ